MNRQILLLVCSLLMLDSCAGDAPEEAPVVVLRPNKKGKWHNRQEYNLKRQKDRGRYIDGSENKRYGDGNSLKNKKYEDTNKDHSNGQIPENNPVVQKYYLSKFSAHPCIMSNREKEEIKGIIQTKANQLRCSSYFDEAEALNKLLNNTPDELERVCQELRKPDTGKYETITKLLEIEPIKLKVILQLMPKADKKSTLGNKYAIIVNRIENGPKELKEIFQVLREEGLNGVPRVELLENASWRLKRVLQVLRKEELEEYIEKTNTYLEEYAVLVSKRSADAEIVEVFNKKIDSLSWDEFSVPLLNTRHQQAQCGVCYDDKEKCYKCPKEGCKYFICEECYKKSVREAHKIQLDLYSLDKLHKRSIIAARCPSCNTPFPETKTEDSKYLKEKEINNIVDYRGNFSNEWENTFKYYVNKTLEPK